MTAFSCIDSRPDSFLICISFIVVYGYQSYFWLARSDISQNWAYFCPSGLRWGRKVGRGGVRKGGVQFYFMLF